MDTVDSTTQVLSNPRTCLRLNGRSRHRLCRDTPAASQGRGRSTQGQSETREWARELIKWLPKKFKSKKGTVAFFESKKRQVQKWLDMAGRMRYVPMKTQDNSTNSLSSGLCNGCQKGADFLSQRHPSVFVAGRNCKEGSFRRSKLVESFVLTEKDFPPGCAGERTAFI